MHMQGDGPEGQPGEGVSTLSDLTALLDGGEEGADGTPIESEEGEEEADAIEGDEGEQAEGGDDEEGGEESTVVLKHDGKDVTLTQSEVVELAQKGFDYTQKTMALAEDRKAAEQERAQAGEFRQRYEDALAKSVGQLKALESVLRESVGGPPPVDLASQDVALYIAQKEQYEARKGQLAEAQQAIANLTEEQARSRQAWISQRASETEAALRSTLPGWNENTMNELVAYAAKHGLGEANFDHVLLEKGLWEMAHKAKAYDALLEKKAQMKPVAQRAAATPAQARNQPPQLARRQEAVKRYGANPSINTLAELL